MAGDEQTGHCGSLVSHTRFAQSTQKKLWPQGRSACVTLASPQIKHFAEPSSESAGLVELAGDGRDGATLGYDQILERAVVVFSKLGDSPSPSSLELQMAPRSPRPPELDELLEHEPLLEKAPELPVDDVIVGKASVGVSK